MSAAARVILASAGTGKTWQLATAYLQLLCRGVAPERMLATSFTRKAAGEILDRILRRLAAAAGSSEDALRLAQDTGVELDPARALELLVARARTIDRFQVCTLDAHFVRIAQACTLELGLPPGWSIQDELQGERLRGEALVRVLARADAHEWEALLARLNREGAPRSVHEALRRALGEAEDCFAMSDEGAWGAIRVPDPVAPQELGPAVVALGRLQAPRTQAGRPDQRWQRALREAQEAALAEDWETLIEKGLGKAILACGGTYYGTEVSAEIQEAFDPLLRQAGHVLGRRLVEQTRATWSLCAEFAREHAELQRSRRLLRFEDLPRRLAAEAARAGVAMDPSRERLRGGVEHLLLDEFQDTSLVQWQALAPLIEHTSRGPAHERSFFCVGDPKQAIYAWRNAEPRVFLDLPGRLGAAREELSVNRRSAPAVLEAVDLVFRSLDANPALLDGAGRPETPREVAREVAAEFAARWTAPEAWLSELRGAALLRSAPAADASGIDPCWRLAAERAAQLEAMEAQPTVAILVRTRKPIPFLLWQLQSMGVHASGEGGNPLDDSAAVRVALSAFQLADHPLDSACHFHVATSPLGEAFGLTAEDSVGTRESWARGVRRRLLERGYAELLAQVHPAVARHYGAWDLGRFEQLEALALQCEATLRPQDFVRRVERQRVEDPTGGRVRVMTIHGAKGLEFDAVLLPELDQPLNGRTPSFVARRPERDSLGPYDCVSRHGNESLRLLIPDLDDLYRRNQRRQIEEELCILYVAMTRAVRHLELIVPAAKDSEKSLPLTPAGLLRAALAPAAAAPPGEELWRARASDVDWAKERPRQARAEEAAGAAPVGRIRLAPPRRERELPRRTPTSLARGLAGAEILAPASEAQRRGLRLHTWLEQVEWLEGFSASDAELEVRALQLGHAGTDSAHDLRRFRELLEGAALRGLLSRRETAARLGCSEDELELLRERRFAQWVEAQAGRELLVGALDRAVIARPAGSVARAELVDFKSDRLGGGEHALAERAELYRPQLEAYRDALARIAGIDPASIRCRLAFLDSGAVVDL